MQKEEERYETDWRCSLAVPFVNTSLGLNFAASSLNYIGYAARQDLK